MLITDLDGTLLRSDRTFSSTCLSTLEALGHQGILRVIATGRSLYSAHKVLPAAFPLDYLIFSSGAGILEWPTQRLLSAYHLTTEEITMTFELLVKLKLDFMLHRPIPDNHHFLYHTTGQENQDFIRRRKLYQAFAAPWDASVPLFEKACQFVVIEPPQDGSPSHYERLKTRLNTLNVIRTTSPLDGQSVWTEIFPGLVSKAFAGEWLAQTHHIDRSTILALGNDYNDLDLLQWAGKSCVVSNAPPDLRGIYTTVRSNNDDGFTDAVKIWINH